MSENIVPRLIVEYFIKLDGEWYAVWASVYAKGFKSVGVDIKIRGGLSMASAKKYLKIRQDSQKEEVYS